MRSSLIQETKPTLQLIDETAAYDTLDCDPSNRCCRTTGELSGRRKHARELPKGTRRTGAYRLLHWPEPPSWRTIGCCRWQGTRAVRGRALPTGDRNKKTLKSVKISMKKGCHGWPKLGFKAHPHMLRHACRFALANKGHDARALTSDTRTSNTRFVTLSCLRIGSRIFGGKGL